MKRIQQALAARPGTEVSAKTLADELATSRQQLAGAMGRHSRTAWGRWGLNEAPFSTRRDYAGKQTYYCMSPDVARIIEASRRAQR